MTKRGLILLVLISLFSLTGKIMAQSVPWSYTATSVNHTIFIKSSINPSIDGTLLETGDAIGVFYLSGNNLECGGYVIWEGENTFITAYGEDENFSGFKENEAFNYKIWKKNSNCIIDSVHVEYNSGGVIVSTDKFNADGISDLKSFDGVSLLKEENFTVKISDATCKTGGRIFIENLVPNKTPSIRLTAFNQQTNQIYTSETMEIIDLPEGQYQILLTSGNCSFTYQEYYEIFRDRNCQFPIITPNADGEAENYYIPYSGVAKIYDRSGVLKKELVIPDIWDATDNANNLLPTGTYIVIIEGQKAIEITILR